MPDLITAELIRLDADLGGDKHAVIRSLATIVGEAGRAHDVDRVVADAYAREETSGTGLPGGIALPHCRTAGVDEPVLAFARLSPGVDFGAADGPAELVFLLVGTLGDDRHLKLLTQLARALVKPAFTQALREAASPAHARDLVADTVGSL